MLIISSYSKKLHCQVGEKSIGVEPNQAMTVGDEIGRALLNSPWITEVKEGVESPIFRPCGIPCRTEKPVEKVKEPIEKREEFVEEKEKITKTEKPKYQKKIKGRYIK